MASVCWNDLGFRTQRLNVADERPDLFLGELVLETWHLRLLAPVQDLVEHDAVRIGLRTRGARQIHVMPVFGIRIRAVALALRAVASLAVVAVQPPSRSECLGRDGHRIRFGRRPRGYLPG